MPKQSIPTRIRKLIRFYVAQRIVGFTVPDDPYLDHESSSQFLSALRGCRFYLEYGSGGSTVSAAKLGKRFISVDTDRFYLEAVRQKIGTLSAEQHLLYADIGLTGPFGTPFFKRATSRRVQRWTSYLEAPWRLVRDGDYPDMILIDGRFRIAAALMCCLHLARSPESRIWVDDSIPYGSYEDIQQYARLIAHVGRMTVFQPNPAVSADALKAGIAKHAKDWL